MMKRTAILPTIWTKYFYLCLLLFVLSGQGCEFFNKSTTSPAVTPTATPTPVPDNILLIADFNAGIDPINSGGKLQKWNHGNFLQVTTGYYDLRNDTNDQANMLHLSLSANLQLWEQVTGMVEVWLSCSKMMNRQST
jgi:hypothetical protein